MCVSKEFTDWRFVFVINSKIHCTSSYTDAHVVVGLRVCVALSIFLVFLFKFFKTTAGSLLLKNDCVGFARFNKYGFKIHGTCYILCFFFNRIYNNITHNTVVYLGTIFFVLKQKKSRLWYNRDLKKKKKK